MSSILVLLSVTKFSDVIIWREEVPFWMMLSLQVGQQCKDESVKPNHPLPSNPASKRNLGEIFPKSCSWGFNTWEMKHGKSLRDSKACMLVILLISCGEIKLIWVVLFPISFFSQWLVCVETYSPSKNNKKLENLVETIFTGRVLLCLGDLSSLS